jgi:hypothetical protein
MINRAVLSRLLSIAVELGEMFESEIAEKICARLVEVVCTADPVGQAALAEELHEILAQAGAAQEQRARGAIH